MLTLTHQKTLDTLKTWLLQLDANEGVEDISPNEDLIDGGLIDSLEFVSFLMLIEDLRGAEITSFEMELDKFRTLNSIIKNFF
ncbi:phosphopantetheine-binding protein [Aureisphaera galaxeae]|uniref:phosphopantetheine-binding protein n=1 Tax=Aureisphaera galaxeae TaxID=1538023 RepID=UPI0023503A78|nr:phosphopantetheine-binding protein [Aureisphaera galaxeae]MDC8004288.1 phosphopantetheine-binding protein [Aureisphaera galaxeae]